MTIFNYKGFYLDGSLKKPVSANLALQQVFTMDKELLCFLSSELRHLKHIQLNSILMTRITSTNLSSNDIFF